jgi:glycyl-tRNA synthetase
MHAMVWKASGHADSFSDPFVKCPACSKFFRLDKVFDDIKESPWFQSLAKSMEKSQDEGFLVRWAKGAGKSLAPNLALVKEPEATFSFIADLHYEFKGGSKGINLKFEDFVRRLGSDSQGIAHIPCPNCGSALPDEGVAANLMLKTSLGPVEETAEKVYLRPETAQGIFVNFANVVDSTHRKLPFGIAQVGKSFRNEVTTKNFIFRSREFEQMEIEYFCRPEQAGEAHERWIQDRLSWYLSLGLNKERLRLRMHAKDELAHYAAGCSDIEYLFPFGWSELEGIANRGDYDLKQHAKFSGKDLQYQDPVTNEKYFPHVIEPSGGCDRATLAFLVDAYHEETVNDALRVVMKFHPKLAPVKVAVLPLLKKNEGIVALAKKIKSELQKDMVCVYDDTAAIGKLYRRQDEVGTVFCVTVDVQSLEDKQVTVRFRDTMQQERIPVERLKEFLVKHLN